MHKKRWPLRQPLLLFILIAFSLQVQALNDSVPKKDSIVWYRKYNDHFIVSYYISQRSYNISINQKVNNDPNAISPVNYFAEANVVSGFSFQYDIFALSVGFKSPVKPEDKVLKGRTNYRDIGITSFGNKIAFEVKYRNYLGFYDKRIGGYYDTISKTTIPYYQNSSMDVRNIKGKIYYFVNPKKFSFPSAYANAQQQVKGAGSWFLVSNIYNLRLKTDTSFIPPRGRGYYDTYADINRFGVTALSIGAGGSRNFVLGKFFLNITVGWGLELQFRKYGYNNETATREKTQIAGVVETRSAIGYNGKSFYVSISGFNDYSLFTDMFHEINTNYYNGQFNIGYRFEVKKPAFMEKLQSTRLYKIF